MHVLITTQAGPVAPPPTKRDFGNVGALFLVILAGCLLVLVVSVLLLRMRTYGKVVVGGSVLEDELARKQRERKPRPDPWSESARRMQAAPPDEGDDDDHDTVDFDPGSLGPDDIEPGDAPPNGKGQQ